MMKTILKNAWKTPLFILACTLLLVLMVLSFVLPDREYSMLENRPLMQYEVPSLDSIASGKWMKRAEEYAAEQFPLRDQLVQINLAKEMLLLRTETNNIVRGRDNRLFERADQADASALQGNTEALLALQQKTGLPLYLGIIPEASQVLKEALPPYYPLVNSWDLMSNRLGLLEGVQVINTQDELVHKQALEDTFYRTDHHLTWAGADSVYRAIAARMGLEAIDVQGHLRQSTGFLGSFYARAPYPFMDSETMAYADVGHLQLYIDGQLKDGLVDQELLARPNKYAALLYNNPGQLRIVNPAVGEGKLLVIRDSHANAILPSLAQHFAVIDALDPRFIQRDFDLSQWIQDQNYGGILCIFGSQTLLKNREMQLLLAAFKK